VKSSNICVEFGRIINPLACDRRFSDCRLFIRLCVVGQPCGAVEIALSNLELRLLFLVGRICLCRCLRLVEFSLSLSFNGISSFASGRERARPGFGRLSVCCSLRPFSTLTTGSSFAANSCPSDLFVKISNSLPRIADGSLSLFQILTLLQEFQPFLVGF